MALSNTEWIWPSETARGVFASYARGTNSHAILITGQYGTGKRTLAGMMANALLCERSPDDRPCGKCGPCVRFATGTHYDAHYIRRGDNKSRTIAVEQIRALTEALGMRSYEGGATVVIIEDADEMQVQAQNALLKCLEEPQGNTCFFLTAIHRMEILPTIRSRCAWLNLPTLSIDIVERELIRRGTDGRLARDAAQYSNGSMGAAIRYAETSGGFLQAIKETLGGMRCALDVPSAAKRALDLFGKKENTESGFDAYDTLEYAMTRGNETFARLPARARLAVFDSIQEARQRDSMYMPKQQALEDLFIRYLNEINKNSSIAKP